MTYGSTYKIIDKNKFLELGPICSDLDALQWRFNERNGVSNRLFTQPFFQAQIKDNIKGPRHWPLWGEFTDDQWILHTKGQ